jgi:hypothetical protein
LRPSRVLSSRRLWRFGAAAFCCLGLLGSGQDDPGSTNQAQPDGHDYGPRAQIELPLDRFAPSAEQESELEYAYQLIVSGCMGRRGYEFRAIDRRGLPLEPDGRYGPLTLEVARRLGYGAPPDSPEENELERESTRSRSRAESHALGRCQAQTTAVVVPEPLQSELVAYRIYYSALKRKRAAQVIRAWHRCLKSHGLAQPKPSNPWLPAGAAVHDTRSALVDVRCKRRTGLVDSLRETESGLERRWIATHFISLRRQRQLVEDKLRAARRIIAGAS